MPKLRSQVLKCLARGETSANNIAKETKLSKRTNNYQLEDLRLPTPDSATWLCKRVCFQKSVEVVNNLGVGILASSF